MMISFTARSAIVVLVGFLGDLVGLRNTYFTWSFLATLCIPFIFMLLKNQGGHLQLSAVAEISPTQGDDFNVVFFPQDRKPFDCLTSTCSHGFVFFFFNIGRQEVRDPPSIICRPDLINDLASRDERQLEFPPNDN
jgi:hypothetical protein